jgi:hypothetical protein
MNRMVFGFLFLFLFVSSCGTSDVNDVVWDFTDINSIGASKTIVAGQPKVIETDKGKAIKFNGVDDGLIVEALPIAGAEKFTIEIIFCPDANGLQTQRFLNLQVNNSKNRLLLMMEASPSDKVWYLQTFIKSSAGTLDMFQAEKFYPTDQWNSVAVIYDGQKLHNYVNGREEFAQPMAFAPLGEGKTSIGMKINRQSFFKGAVRKIRFTRQALNPDKLLKP